MHVCTYVYERIALIPKSFKGRANLLLLKIITSYSYKSGDSTTLGRSDKIMDLLHVNLPVFQLNVVHFVGHVHVRELT